MHARTKMTALIAHARTRVVAFIHARTKVIQPSHMSEQG